jgi:hypothetical protein
MRTWTLWALPAVLALTLAASARAQQSSPPPPDKHEDLAAQLKTLTNEIAGLRREIELLRRDLTDSSLRGARMSVDLHDLEQRLNALQGTVQRQDDAVRRALSINPQAVPGAVPAAVPATGTIMLRNFSRVAGTFVVNGRGYPVMPGDTLSLERMPAGTFSYEITADGFGVLRPMTTRVLNAGQTFFLNIDPQP